MRVVHAEDAHAVPDPEQHDVAQRAPQPQLASAARRRAIEGDVDDILIFLGRILGVPQGSVRAPGKPLGVLRQPGVVGRALDGEVQRDLHSLPARGVHQPQEILQRSQLGFDGIVPAAVRSDGVGAADIIGFGAQAVVAALAVALADGMDGRQVEHVEPHVAHVRQPGDDIVEGAVPAGLRGLGPREQFVPA
ncbi:hypothetical protein D3C86_1552240 [compost metagenome]